MTEDKEYLGTEYEEPLLTDSELQAIAVRQSFRNRLALMASVIQVVATVGFVLIAIILLSSSSQQKAFSQRSDCKTSYSSILTKPVTNRDDLQAEVSALSGNLQSQLGAALLSITTGPNGRVSQSVVDAFATTKSALDAKRAELEISISNVKALPSLATASNHGFTLNNIHYPACPKAS